VGVHVLLHGGEVDDGMHGYCFLNKPPTAIVVRPLDTTVSTTTWEILRQTYPTMPLGCPNVAHANISLSCSWLELVLPNHSNIAV
jgi:hypothetical protein